MEKNKRRSYLRFLAVQIEKLYDAFHRFLARVTGRLGKPMVAEIYHATPVKDGVAIKGRVLLARKVREPRPEDSRLTNLVQMIKRWATPERPNSRVRVSLGGEAVEQIADGEGYFDIRVPAEEHIQDKLVIELPDSEVSQPAIHELYDVGENFEHLVISDIDDTVLVTHAATTLRMLATTMLGNALTRQLFPGTPELYRALRDGADPKQPRANPLCYVTSSPFNLHSLLHLVFEENGLPVGPFFMTDWGIDLDKWFKKSHHEHKVEAIEEALDWYPDKPVILIGDSGQHDTMIYVEMALTHPHRIDLILIRDVCGPERIAELSEEIVQLEDAGTAFSFFSDTAEAAKILTEHGWISKEQQQTVVDASNHDEA